MAAIDHISGFCSQGKHGRCGGWMVIPDESAVGRRAQVDQSVRCECPTCHHPPVHKYRHLHEAQERGETYGVH